jgi:hypothetical protein
MFQKYAPQKFRETLFRPWLTNFKPTKKPIGKGFIEIFETFDQT